MGFKELDADRAKILIDCGTEPAFSGKLLYEKRKGKYFCAACGTELFSSDDKFDSGTGWPSFDKAKNVVMQREKSILDNRTEVRCAKCGGHLGHVFSDGPTPTKKRFCINSLALEFEEKR